MLGNIIYWQIKHSQVVVLTEALRLYKLKVKTHTHEYIKVSARINHSSFWSKKNPVKSTYHQPSGWSPQQHVRDLLLICITDVLNFK